MPSTSFEATHSHSFGESNPLAEKRTRQVMILTAVMMVIEIVAGTVFGSMALLADGWHMSSHAVALGVAAGAYALSRRYAADPRFAFGTWKIEVLGGYTSALFLLAVALYMGIESAHRLLNPVAIHFEQALWVAILGLAVNAVSAYMLSRGTHHHGHGHAHQHEHAHAHDHGSDPAPPAHHHDLNLKAAYLHVVADALTSVLAIVALLGGRYIGASWLDPAMGLLGMVLVGRWAISLLRETTRVLLDAEMDAPVVEEVREAVRGLAHAVIRDLHVWRVGRGKYACILSLESQSPLAAEQVHRALRAHSELVHITVEVA